MGGNAEDGMSEDGEPEDGGWREDVDDCDEGASDAYVPSEVGKVDGDKEGRMGMLPKMGKVMRMGRMREITTTEVSALPFQESKNDHTESFGLFPQG